MTQKTRSAVSGHCRTLRSYVMINVLRRGTFGCLLVVATAVARTAEFPAVYNSETETSAAPPSPQESLAKLSLPPGFKATVFAAEPDVQNPIGMAWDARGRLWIAENYTYAER